MDMALEMSRNLRQLVDNSFEEAQFESAVSTLDILRSPHHTPSPVHLLYLIFISLHPSTHPSNLEDPTAQPLSTAALLQQSPRKMIKHTKASALFLSPPAVLAAHRLLHAFLRTNGPDIFVRALPSYAQHKLGVDAELDFVDSPIHQQALAIRNARAVWDIIKEGFVLRVAKALPPPVKGRAGPKGKMPLVRDPSFTAPTSADWTAQDDLKPVADDSWQVLECLVELFEADADRSGSPKHSLILLSQLPLPPIGSHTRWDASEPLKVVFYALAQHDNPRKVRLGLRLLLLLIDLSHTTYLNLPSFATNVLVQLSAAAPSFSSLPSSSTSTSPPSHHQKALTHLLSLLPSSTPAQCAFRMVLCRKILLGLEDPDSVGRDVVQHAHGIPPPSPVKTVNGASTVMGVSTSSVAATGANANANANLNARPRPKPIPKRRKIVVEGDTVAEGVKPAPASTSTPIPSPSIPPPPTPAPPQQQQKPKASSRLLPQQQQQQQQRPKATPQHVPLATLEEMARLLSLVPPPLAPLPVRTSVKRKAPMGRGTKARTSRVPGAGAGGSKANGTASTSTSNANANANANAKQKPPSKPQPRPAKPPPRNTVTTRSTRASSRAQSVVPGTEDVGVGGDVGMTTSSSGAGAGEGGGKLDSLAEEHADDDDDDVTDDATEENRNTDHEQEHEPENPYTTPFPLLLRVRFEFVRAWMFVRFGFGDDDDDNDANNHANGANGANDPTDPNYIKERQDREELGRLIHRFFSASGSASDGDVLEQEEEDVGRDRSLYRELLMVALFGCD